MNSVIREIKLEGSFNFRDLGGYQTKEGYNVKGGQLFRSGNLSRLTKSDLDIVNSLGIKNICDLRGLDEIEQFPDPILEGASWIHIPVISDEKLVRQVGDLAEQKHDLDVSNPGEMLIKLNRKITAYTSTFRRVFEILLSEPQAPLLFHCMAGKDRTGAVAALILSVLGVPREIITDDYLYTNNTLGQMKAHFQELGFGVPLQFDPSILDAMFEARVEYINAFFDELENQFGSVDSYIKESIGLTTEDIHILKSHLLE